MAKIVVQEIRQAGPLYVCQVLHSLEQGVVGSVVCNETDKLACGVDNGQGKNFSAGDLAGNFLLILVQGDSQEVALHF